MSADLQPLLPGIPPPLEDDPDRRYTLRHTLEWCKRVAGVDAFDLDVAADDEAHVCERYYTARENGLTQPWSGRVWCNPPYSDIGPWVRRAWGAMFGRNAPEVVAMLLPANRSEQPWFQVEVEPYRDGRYDGPVRLTTHYLPGRQSFGRPGNPLGVNVGSPEFGCVLLLWRRT
jgi:phage N-6-adenine-methyltransferase